MEKVDNSAELKQQRSKVVDIAGNYADYKQRARTTMGAAMFQEDGVRVSVERSNDYIRAHKNEIWDYRKAFAREYVKKKREDEGHTDGDAGADAGAPGSGQDAGASGNSQPEGTAAPENARNEGISENVRNESTPDGDGNPAAPAASNAQAGPEEHHAEEQDDISDTDIQRYAQLNNITEYDPYFNFNFSSRRNLSMMLQDYFRVIGSDGNGAENLTMLDHKLAKGTWLMGVLEKVIGANRAARPGLGENTLNEGQKAGLSEIAKFLYQNCARRESRKNIAMVEGLMLKPARERLFIYYMIENELYEKATEDDVVRSQTYTPSLERFKSVIERSWFNIIGKGILGRVHWSYLSKASKLAMRYRAKLAELGRVGMTGAGMPALLQEAAPAAGTAQEVSPEQNEASEQSSGEQTGLDAEKPQAGEPNEAAGESSQTGEPNEAADESSQAGEPNGAAGEPSQAGEPNEAADESSQAPESNADAAPAPQGAGNQAAQGDERPRQAQPDPVVAEKEKTRKAALEKAYAYGQAYVATWKALGSKDDEKELAEDDRQMLQGIRKAFNDAVGELIKADEEVETASDLAREHRSVPSAVPEGYRPPSDTAGEIVLAAGASAALATIGTAGAKKLNIFKSWDTDTDGSGTGWDLKNLVSLDTGVGLLSVAKGAWTIYSLYKYIEAQDGTMSQATGTEKAGFAATIGDGLVKITKSGISAAIAGNTIRGSGIAGSAIKGMSKSVAGLSIVSGALNVVQGSMLIDSARENDKKLDSIQSWTDRKKTDAHGDMEDEAVYGSHVVTVSTAAARRKVDRDIKAGTAQIVGGVTSAVAGTLELTGVGAPFGKVIDYLGTGISFLPTIAAFIYGSGRRAKMIDGYIGLDEIKRQLFAMNSIMKRFDGDDELDERIREEVAGYMGFTGEKMLFEFISEELADALLRGLNMNMSRVKAMSKDRLLEIEKAPHDFLNVQDIFEREFANYILMIESFGPRFNFNKKDGSFTRPTLAILAKDIATI